MHTLYIRTLKRAEHTVFCVADGQKTYYDTQFGRRLPYSSGQQVKRSIIDSLNSVLNLPGSPTTFLFDVNKKGELKEGEVFGTCNPSYPDQLLGGWMKAAKGGKERTLKRRSPLSISAMRALHPLLAGTNSENATFDRSDRANNQVIVRDEKGNELDTEAIAALLAGKDRSLSRKWIPNNSRAHGLFVQDIAIDLRRLFSVSLNPLEPAISETVEEALREAGWQECQNVFGPCLVAPAALRSQWIESLTKALIDWKITSNQARTFSLMETLAMAISEDANRVAASIRAKLTEEDKALPIIETEIDKVETYVTLPASGYLLTQTESIDALDRARQSLIDKLSAYPYENQLQSV